MGTGSSGAGRLPVVQVHLLLGAHDDVVARPRRRRCRPRSRARRTRRRSAASAPEPAALQDLVPADQPAAARGEPAVEVPDEPGLQLVLVGQPELPDAGLGGRGGPPLVLGALVAADVDER